MNIELEIKDIKHDLNYAKNCEYDHVTLDVYKVQALLTAYEKEKETSHYVQSQLDIANAKLVEELKKKPMFLIKDIYSPKIKEINLQDIEGLIEQGREEVKDKIKAKIEEIKNECKYCNFLGEICQELLQNNNCTQGNTLKVLQSLLEKE